MGYIEGLLMNDEREMENTPMVECPACDGSGVYERYINEWDIHDEICLRCEGDGKIEDYLCQD